MKLYSENKNYKLYNGNMLDMLDVIEKESIDSIVTDPPYGLTSITKRFGKESSAPASTKNNDGSFARLSKGFMGKEWDGSGIEYNIDTWKKCYEVLKPGGYLLAFGGSRTFHRIACAIEDAGFEIRDTIMWLYGSGFPKSMDISKQIDKRGGKNTSFLCNLIKEKREEKNLSQKQLDELMGTSGMVNWWEKGERGITPIQFNKLCEILELPFKNIEEAEREVIGSHKMLSGWNLEENKFVDRDITLPSTDLAKKWQGWGTALKPSFEPIIVARKPFKGSLVDNVIENGVGGINIDECRVENNNNEKLTRKLYDNPSWKNSSKAGQGSIDDTSDRLGRFPANTILTYDEIDFDEVCGGFPDTKTGWTNNDITKTKENIVVDFKNKVGFTGNHYNDSGSASRYFYCAKASKKDRDEGLDEFEEKKTGSMMANIGGNMQLGGASLKGEPKEIQPKKNTHPTVKPTDLMQYLVRLVTPNGGTILDPFNGSGSTGKAVMYENKEKNKNYKYIGIELTEEYLPIAKARIEYVCGNETAKQEKLDLYDLD